MLSSLTGVPDSRFQPVQLAGTESADFSLSRCDLDDRVYWALSVTETHAWYLYTSSPEQAADGVIDTVLGVFDTLDQLRFFLTRYDENRLFIPALKYRTPWPVCHIASNTLVYPRFEGVYRVGFKSYTVEVDTQNPELRVVHYIQDYRTQYLGCVPEKDACILLYSHFDQRLRGCKMC